MHDTLQMIGWNFRRSALKDGDGGAAMDAGLLADRDEAPQHCPQLALVQVIPEHARRPRVRQQIHIACTRRPHSRSALQQSTLSSEQRLGFRQLAWQQTRRNPIPSLLHGGFGARPCTWLRPRLSLREAFVCWCHLRHFWSCTDARWRGNPR